MTKLYYLMLALIIFLLVAVGVTVYVQTTNHSSTHSSGYTTLPTGSSSSPISNAFLTAPSVTPDVHNTGSYFLGNTFAPNASTGASSSYVITYDSSAKYFNIALLQKPLATSRQAAEVYLKNLLQLDNASLCNLSYTVSIPGYVDEAASGIDYRFSFCPGAVPLP